MSVTYQGTTVDNVDDTSTYGHVVTAEHGHTKSNVDTEFFGSDKSSSRMTHGSTPRQIPNERVESLDRTPLYRSMNDADRYELISTDILGSRRSFGVKLPQAHTGALSTNTGQNTHIVAGKGIDRQTSSQSTDTFRDDTIVPPKAFRDVHNEDKFIWWPSLSSDRGVNQSCQADIPVDSCSRSKTSPLDHQGGEVDELHLNSLKCRETSESTQQSLPEWQANQFDSDTDKDSANNWDEPPVPDAAESPHVMLSRSFGRLTIALLPTSSSSSTYVRTRTQDCTKSQSDGNVGTTSNESYDSISSKKRLQHYHNDLNGKRKRTCDDNGEDDDDDDRNMEGPSRIEDWPEPDHSEHFFACPYAKYDLARYSMCNNKASEASYRNCQSRRFPNITRVKIHLRRCHALPQHLCLRCRVAFKTDESLQKHSQGEICEAREGPYTERMSKGQLAEVNGRMRGLDPQDKWFKIFDILFPNSKHRPLSPYFEETSTEGVKDMHVVIMALGSERFANIVPCYKLSPTGQQNMVKAMESIDPNMCHRLRLQDESTSDQAAGYGIPDPFEEYTNQDVYAGNENVMLTTPVVMDIESDMFGSHMDFHGL